MIHSSPCETSPLAMIIDPRLTRSDDYGMSVAGLSLFRRDQPAPPAVGMVEPSLILVAWVQMSAATFHYHFRQLIAMSLLQYQKWLRLNEARRLMLSERLDVSRAVFAVMKVRRSSAANTADFSVLRPDAISRECAARHPKPSLMDKRTSASTGAALHHRL